MDECQETIKKVVEEGLAARNLVNYISDGSLDVAKTVTKPPTSPRPHSVSPKPPILNLSKDDSRILKIRRKAESPRAKPRLRSASAGRNPEKDLRARYWTFLFENLHRAVDEIYQTCEVDESIIECKEAIMVLDNYSKDFHALIQYININQKYEKTASINRPTSLAWEIRKSSPGKSLLKNIFIERLTAGSSQAKKVLCFDKISFPRNISESDASSLESNSTALNSNCLDKSCRDEITSKEVAEDHNVLLSKKECGITVSVVPEVNETFPCNDKLIINEICCVTDKTFMKKSNVITEIDNECVNQDCECMSFVPLANDLHVDSIQPCNGNKKRKESGSVIHSDIVNSDCQTELEKNLTNNITTEKAKNNDDNITHLHDNSKKEMHNESIFREISSNCNKVDQYTNSIPEKGIIQNKVNFEEESVSNISDRKKAPLKKKVLVKKSAKANSEKTLSNSKQFVLSEDKNNIQNNLKLSNTSASSKNIDKDKIILKPVSKDSEAITMKKNDENMTKNLGSSVAAKKTVAKPLSEKNLNTSVNRQPSTVVEKSVATSVTKQSATKSSLVVRKVSPKTDVCEEKKSAKTHSKISAIQRNISYVSSLSTKNQLEKAVNEEKKKPLRTISHAMKMPPKSGSMSSLNKISAAHRWSNKASSVEQIPEIIKSNADEDSDGWETVRGRNRCRNSPAKKIPFSSEKNDKALDLAKLNQSRFGGFPYTTKNNAKSSSVKVTTKKTEKITNKNPLKTENTNSKSHDLSDTQTSCAKKSNNNRSNTSNSNNMSNQPKLKYNENVSDMTLTTDTKSKNEKLITELQLSEDIANKIKNNAFKINKLHKSASCPYIFREYPKSLYSLSKAKSLSEQSLHIKKYSKIQHFGRNSIEKSLNFTKKKGRKSGIQSQASIDDALNASLDESDTGLISDDQEGQTSHDEAFDAHCQDLCDTAWKYKILEQQVHKLELSWGEQMDRFDMELRTPGRALEMHEKLSSPFRKKSLMESIRLQEEKQVKAREQRERLLEEKLKKAKEIEKKRQEMKTLLEQRQEKQRILMEQKLQRAEEKRKKQLELIVKKAHDEEEKVNEIAFINTLEAQNKRHDLISKEKDHEARLHDIQEERQRKQEEKAAKEAAAEERRKLLEAERQARLNEMQEKRKMRDHKVVQLLLVKEKERQELANQKARDREQRLSALNAQQQNTIEELQKKIQLKQEESARRHEENIELIRQKAFELSVRRCSSNNDDAPQPLPYETKKICTLCNVLIGSEVYLLSHLRGKKHQETVKDQYQGKDPSTEELEVYNLKHIVDASTDQLDPNIALDKERQKALKKRCKKLRQRMSNRGQDYESQLETSTDSVNSNGKTKMSKITADIKKLITNSQKSSDNNLLTSLERCLNEIESLLEKKLHQDKIAFRMVGGLSTLIDAFKLLSGLSMEKSGFLHKKITSHLTYTAELIIDNCHENCIYILFSNKIGSLLDSLIQRLTIFIPNNFNQVISTSKSPGLNIKVDVTSGKLLHFLSSILTTLGLKHTQLNQGDTDSLTQKENQPNDFQFRVQDAISYIVSIGIVDKLSQYFNSIQGPISNEAEVANFLLDCIAFLTSLIKLYSDCFTSCSSLKTDDSTQLIATIKVTNMIGSISFLYGLLLHSGVSSRGDTPPPQLANQIELLVISTLRMLNYIAVMNLQAFQTILGSEGLSLQLRHITSHLLWYCNHWTADTMLHEIILLVGYFTVLNIDNQSLIQAGQRPTVLQQLCSLPFLYFSDSELTDILFPTLIACCYKNSNNKTILEQEMSSELLYDYIQEKYLTNEDYSKKPKKAAPEKRWLFSTRFPKNYWSSAKQYFAVNQG